MKIESKIEYLDKTSKVNIKLSNTLALSIHSFLASLISVLNNKDHKKFATLYTVDIDNHSFERLLSIVNTTLKDSNIGCEKHTRYIGKHLTITTFSVQNKEIITQEYFDDLKKLRTGLRKINKLLDCVKDGEFYLAYSYSGTK